MRPTPCDPLMLLYSFIFTFYGYALRANVYAHEHKKDLCAPVIYLHLADSLSRRARKKERMFMSGERDNLTSERNM